MIGFPITFEPIASRLHIVIGFPITFEPIAPRLHIVIGFPITFEPIAPRLHIVIGFSITLGRLPWHKLPGGAGRCLLHTAAAPTIPAKQKEREGYTPLRSF
ncbi:hypothetical protein [Paenibacillus sp. FSL R7-269]|uniref:hypothetical protein n=1 Tax=Paenibacillus sp. FSL R7-269 TaxID=1226755 RepID=UPI0012EB06DA|nr:hypothetical protein [Paenibacillus sp. FSL R7-269]